MAETTAEAITATWREESARLVGALTRMTRDLDLAEDLTQDALVSALEEWPTHGVPSNPGAWLMTTAKRRAHRWLPARHQPTAQDRRARSWPE